MKSLDPNRIVLFAGLAVLFVVTGVFGYRLEIGRDGIRFEGPKAPASIERPGQ
jgi:hypothetical protein